MSQISKKIIRAVERVGQKHTRERKTTKRRGIGKTGCRSSMWRMSTATSRRSSKYRRGQTRTRAIRNRSGSGRNVSSCNHHETVRAIAAHTENANGVSTNDQKKRERKKRNTEWVNEREQKKVKAKI